MSSTETIFEKILNRTIPCSPVYEDDFVLAFPDINPQAPIHILIIPKKKIVNVNFLQEEDAPLMGRLLLAAKTIAQQQGIAQDGYRLVFNNEAGAGQSVFYLHCHLLGGRPLAWPPG